MLQYRLARLSIRGAYLLLTKLTKNSLVEIPAFGISGKKLGVLMRREIEITVDCAAAKLQIERLLLLSVSTRRKDTRLQWHPVHTFVTYNHCPKPYLRSVRRKNTFYLGHPLPPYAFILKFRLRDPIAECVGFDKGFRLADEIAYIQDKAADHDGRIVTIAQLILFSTDTVDAWLLDVTDKLAARLAMDGDPEPIYLEETDTSFAIEWKGHYRIEGAAFIYADRDTGRITTILGYPILKIAHAG
jgi:hypothetical protein